MPACAKCQGVAEACEQVSAGERRFHFTDDSMMSIESFTEIDKHFFEKRVAVNDGKLRRVRSTE